MKKLLLLFLLLNITLFADGIVSAKELVGKAKASINEVNAQQLYNMLNKNILIIDVREPYETHKGKIDYKNSINIPRGLLEFKISKYDLSAYDRVVIYCQAGARGALATLRLQDMGYKNLYNLKGGFKKWEDQCGPSLEFDDLYFDDEDEKKPLKSPKGCLSE